MLLYRLLRVQMLLRMLLRVAAFTHRSFFTIQGVFYTEQLLHTDTQVLLHTDAFTQQCFYTHVLYTGSLVTQSILYTEKTFAQQMLLRADVRCFTHKYIYTEPFFTQILRRYFLKEVFCTMLLHRDAFTHRRF